MRYHPSCTSARVLPSVNPLANRSSVNVNASLFLTYPLRWWGIRSALGILLLVFAACERPADAPSGSPTSETSPSKGITHPTPENLPGDGEADNLIEMSNDVQSESELSRYAFRLRAAEKTLTIGTVEGNPHEVLGKVADVAADKHGTIYVLDSRRNQLRLYDAEGAPLSDFGGPGRGPKEFQFPNHLDLTRQNRLAITDRNGLLKIFTIEENTSFSHRGTIQLRSTFKGLCVRDGLFYVTSVDFATDSEEPKQQKSIRAFSLKGEPVASFHSSYKSGNSLVRSELSGGPLACSNDVETVVTGHAYLPVLSGYDSQGKRKWVSKLAAFKPMEMVEKTDVQGRPTVAYSPTPASSGEESDVISALVAVPDGYVIAQIHRRTQQSIRAGNKYAEVHTYLVDATTGEGVYVGDNLPPVYDVTADRIYAGVNLPFPQVKVYRLPRGGA